MDTAMDTAMDSKNSGYEKLKDKVLSSLDGGDNILIHAPAGNGKCLAMDTPVLMYNGSIKMSQHIKKGDKVMGDDSTPRDVLGVCSGTDDLYEVTTDRGDNYIVNSHHILTLHTTSKYRPFTSFSWMRSSSKRYELLYGDEEGKIRRKKCQSMEHLVKVSSEIDRTLDIPISECIGKGGSDWHDYFKGLYSKINFFTKKVPVDPYVVGLWVGHIETNPTIYIGYLPEGVKRWFEMNTHYKLETIGGRYAFSYRNSEDSLEDTLLKMRRDEAYIPRDYRINSSRHRRAVLAGIIDIRGWVSKISDNTQVYEIPVNSTRLLEDVLYTARSLGYIVKHRVEQSTFIIEIGGENLNLIPVKCKHNRITCTWYTPRSTKSTPNLYSDISINYMGRGRYYGFEISGNKRFVLGNFIVTHNSHLIKDLYATLKPRMNINLTSTTGVSAFNIGKGCRTVNSFTGVMTGDKDNDYYIRKIRRNKKQMGEITGCKVMVIDEISMLGDEIFEKIDIICRVVRGNTKPFGGIQLVASGDFLQIPPVGSDFCFMSKIWGQMNFTNFMLSVPYRHRNDVSFYRMLMRIRRGKTMPKDVARLHERHRVYYEMTDQAKAELGAVILYPKNRDVDDYNRIQLEELEGKEFVFTSTKVGNHTKKDGIEDKVTLKVGAQVMLNINLDVEAGLVNGATGFVKECSNQSVTVRFVNGLTITLERHEYILDEENGVKIIQIPLKLSWAVSIHKSQSCTLDKVVIDLGGCFEKGQAYVALSRARTLDGVFLTDFEEKSLRTDEDAIDFEKNLLGI